MAIVRDPKLDKAQVRAFAFKVLRRVHGLGAKTQTIDDIESELWVAWCIACDRYSAEGGAAFSTYLYSGMRRHINRWIEKNFERFHEETIAASLDAQVFSDENGELGSQVGHLVADPQMTQDEAYQRENCFAYALSRVSPRAGQFLKFLKEHPPELMERMKDLEAKAEYAKEQGVNYAMPHRLTSSMILDFMGASRVERKQIMDEVTQIGQLISQ
ncbi:sigma factor (plasmid) [Rhizobium beringeri]|uniref:sigma factor n=1 Tax=Rhizobium beringeri TaxID=3019934 RepID=UPI002DDCB719|nr:sigma factor [Rhizobium beringeri]WSG93531.1 sigma factor [Rhizobium beringeri]